MDLKHRQNISYVLEYTMQFKLMKFRTFICSETIYRKYNLVINNNDNILQIKLI